MPRTLNLYSHNITSALLSHGAVSAFALETGRVTEFRFYSGGVELDLSGVTVNFKVFQENGTQVGTTQSGSTSAHDSLRYFDPADSGACDVPGVFLGEAYRADTGERLAEFILEVFPNESYPN